MDNEPTGSSAGHPKLPSLKQFLFLIGILAFLAVIAAILGHSASEKPPTGFESGTELLLIHPCEPDQTMAVTANPCVIEHGSGVAPISDNDGTTIAGTLPQATNSTAPSSQSISGDKGDDYISGTSGEVLTQTTTLSAGETYTAADGSISISLGAAHEEPDRTIEGGNLTITTAATTTIVHAWTHSGDIVVPSANGNLYVVICSVGLSTESPGGFIDFIIRNQNQTADCIEA